MITQMHIMLMGHTVFRRLTFPEGRSGKVQCCSRLHSKGHLWLGEAVQRGKLTRTGWASWPAWNTSAHTSKAALVALRLASTLSMFVALLQERAHGRRHTA